MAPEEKTRHLDTRRLLLMFAAGALVTFVAGITLMVGAFNRQSDELTVARRERGVLSRKLDESVATNKTLQSQVGDLKNLVEALRAQLLDAGLQPTGTPSGTPRTGPTSSPTTTAPPASSGGSNPTPPSTQPPPTTQPPHPQPTVCLLGVCVP